MFGGAHNLLNIFAAGTISLGPLYEDDILVLVVPGTSNIYVNTCKCLRVANECGKIKEIQNV